MDASADFQRARRAYIAARALRWLPSWRTDWARPRALDGVRAFSWAGSSLSVIPLEAIVGTADATTDFDADFRPTTNRISARWQRVALAHRRGHPLPPITAIEHPDGYYIVDGRHRVSVARALGQTDIEAWVSPTTRPAGRGLSRAPR
jgi:ParB-like nuclease domain